MKKNDQIYLEHIIESFKKVNDYLYDVDYVNFIKDEEKQDAVIRKIEVAGEATKRISEQLREAQYHIPWRAIAGMRDKLIHEYFQVDIDTVWETASKDIPDLLPQLEAVLRKLQ